MTKHSAYELGKFIMHIRTTAVVLSLAFFLGATATIHAQSGKGTYEFDIAANDLMAALEQLGERTGLTLVYDRQWVEGKKAEGVHGRMDLDRALSRLLRTSELTWRYVNADTVVLKRAEAKENDEASTNNRTSQTLEDSQEIIVTATRRAERLQDVPLSISVVTAEDIDRRGLVSSGDYLRGIPGVNQTERSRGQTIVIRGLTTSTAGGENEFSGTTIATYFGETPTSTSSGLAGATSVDLKLVDIERVEVLRGPQGTAFGNSSLGGAVRTIPVAPKLERFEGKATVGYSSTSGTGGDNYNAVGVANVPLIHNKLALRASVYRFEETGFYRNVAASDPAFQSAIGVWGAQAFATNQDHIGSSRFTGGRAAALLQVNDSLKLTLSYLRQESELDGQVFSSTSRGYEQSQLEMAPEHQRAFRGEKFGAIDNNIDLVNTMLEYDLGWVDLLASYSYIKSGSTLPFSVGALPWSLGIESPHREHIGEVRLTTKFAGAWNFLGGLYVEDLYDEMNVDYLWYGTSALNFIGNTDEFLGEYHDQRNLQQKAAFLEASWKFLPRFTLTAGARAYDYDRTGTVVTSGSLFGGGSVVDSGIDASGVSLRGNLSYKPSDNVLLYTGWAQGFRLGKPQAGLPPGLCDTDNDGIVDGSGTTIDSTQRVDSDTVDSYEFGGKFTLRDGRVQITADAYRVNWVGVPFTVRATCSAGGAIPYTANAGAARSEGIEFQANSYVAQSFRVDVGGSWIKAELTEDVPAQNFLKGDRLPGSPEFNANLGLQYEFKIGGSDASVRFDAIYVGPFQSVILSDFAASQRQGAGDYVKVDLSARMVLRNANVSLFLNNLTNRDEFVFGGEQPDDLAQPFFGTRLRPRTIGLRLSYDF